MNDAGFSRLVELSWRRKLTEAEEQELRALLAAHPELQAQWEADLALSQSLQRLPDVPLPSNFTARVLTSIDTAERVAGRDQTPGRSLLSSLQRRWLPRLAFGAVLASAGLLTYRHQHALSMRREYAQSVAAVSEVATLPNADVLQNFEAIRQLSSAPGPDDQLLAILQ